MSKDEEGESLTSERRWIKGECGGALEYQGGCLGKAIVYLANPLTSMIETSQIYSRITKQRNYFNGH